MSIGTGWLMISLNKSSPMTIVLFHPGRAELLSGFH